MMDTLRDFGFECAEKKCGPPATQHTFLGVLLDTDTDGEGTCSAAVDFERRKRLIAACDEVANASTVRLSELQSLLGKLSFCAQVVEMSRGFLRSSFTALKGAMRNGAHKHARITVSDSMRSELHWWRKCFSSAAPRTLLTRRVVSTAFASWDASVTKGFGGYYGGKYFAVMWDQLAGWRDQRAYYPTVNANGRALEPINYLELFAGYWWVRQFAKYARGQTVVVFTDNRAAEGMLKSFWGEGKYLTLLKHIRQMLLRWDVRLQVHWIGTKENILSDALSRGDMRTFNDANAAFLQQSAHPQDSEDWQMRPDIVHGDLDREFGPFDTDGATDRFRANAQFPRSWTAAEDCRVVDWAGRNVYINAPFSLLEATVLRFLECKRSCPLGTAALFIVPVWRSAPFYAVLRDNPTVFTVVRRWAAGSPLFTRPVPPHRGGGREYVGPTRWEVEAWWASPAAPSANTVGLGDPTCSSDAVTSDAVTGGY